MNDIIKKLKASGLVGRSGSNFPTWQKWSMVEKAVAAKPAGQKRCFVVCNASEGEPGILKDYFLLENHADKVVAGMKIAMTFLKAEQGIIYLNPNYYKKLEKKLKAAIGKNKIVLFKKDHSAGYIGGEETSALNHIEGKRIEPRLRPPFPPTNGLYNCPTLVNNVETFYSVYLINNNKYKNNRFYTINGDCLYTGVYEFPADWTIAQILTKTDNYPKFDFFVQTGGDASGTVYNSQQLDRPANGAGSITVYSILKNNPVVLIKKWLDFFGQESCGQCTPCREGNYRLSEILNTKNPDWPLFKDVLDTLEQTAFCGLGAAVPWPIKSYLDNVVLKTALKDKMPNKQEINIF